MPRTSRWRVALVAAWWFVSGVGAYAGENESWTVGKSSGEVWIAAGGAQTASLKQDDAIKPGDTIRTGQNGRVLLRRGEESILISPNSVVGIPGEKKDGMSTTILQQAGSILLDVEKRNVKHFEVETPYLAAVVKGTQFAVTVDGKGTRVDVRRGQVEVADFKTGQIAQVTPGQSATSMAHGAPGLTLSGSGVFSPVQQGSPRASTIERVPVPKGGLTMPMNSGKGTTVHALQDARPKSGAASGGRASRQAGTEPARVRRGGFHISSTLGDVRLNVGKATNGLAHGSTAVVGSASRDAAKDIIWSDPKQSGNASAYGQTAAGSASVTAGGSAAAAASPSAAATAAAAASGSANNGAGGAAVGNSNGATGNGRSGNMGGGNGGNGNNGNGNSGNGNGNNGNGNNGNGNGNGNNGNGNGGVGNGNGNGNLKH